MVPVVRILFASLPAHGHFKPLTGLAVELRRRGHDVRWYTGPSYAGALAALGVPHLPFERADDVNGENLMERFPEYAKLHGPKQIAFAAEKIFFGSLEAHTQDMCAIHARFPFEALLAEGGTYASRLVSEKLGVPLYVVYPSPTPAPRSREAPPPFFGLHPKAGMLGRLRDRFFAALVDSSLKGGTKILHDARARVGLPPYDGHPFDLYVDAARAIFEIGCPGMEFPRTDWPPNHEFVGPLVAHRGASRALPEGLEAKIAAHRSVVVVSQGTIDNRDPQKLFVPSLEALRGSEHLVVVATGGQHTADLRARYAADNVVVEDWIDFDQLLPRASVFVCNGGYGSVMQALLAGVPILAAGTNEGKNDINARLAYRELAIDLRTERPTPKQIRSGVARLVSEPRFREAVARVGAELRTYQPFDLVERRLLEGSAQAPARAS